MTTHRMFQSALLGLSLASGLATLSTHAFASEPMPANYVPPEKRNAAIRYLTAVTILSPELAEKLKAIDWAVIGSNIDPEKMPPAFKDASQLKYQHVLDWTTEGSRMTLCNFESSYENGVSTLLPHLGQVRQLARLLRFDARILLTQGNADAAADRVLTMLRLASHIKEDGWFINVLLAAAIDKPAFDEIAVLSTSPHLTAPKRAELLATLERMNVPDPLHFAGAVETERRSILASLDRDAAKPDGPKVVSALFDDAPEAVKIAAMSHVELRKQVAMLPAMYDQFAIALNPATSDEDARKIYEKVHAGAYGLIGAAFMPDPMNLRKNLDIYKANLLKTIDALKAVPAPKER